MTEENVFRLEIAMNHFFGVQQYETAQDLLRKATDEFQRESLEIVSLDEFIEVHAQKFGRDAQMTAEIKALGEVDHTVTAMRIPFLELLQKVHLDQSLLVKSFLIADDFNRDKTAGFVVNASHDLPKTSLAQHVDHLVPICEVVTDDNVVIAPIVIIAEIGSLRIEVAHMLLGMLRATEIDVFEVNNFSAFKDVQACHPESLPGRYALLGSGFVPEFIQFLCGVLKVFASTTKLAHLLISKLDIRILDRIGRC